MNKFGTTESQPLINKMRKGATAVFLATEEPVARDISEMLKDAADSLEAAENYRAQVEGALA